MSILCGLDPTLQYCRLGPRRFGTPQNLPVESYAFEPVMQTNQVGESHTTMHLGRRAGDKAMDVSGM